MDSREVLLVEKQDLQQEEEYAREGCWALGQDSQPSLMCELQSIPSLSRVRNKL